MREQLRSRQQAPFAEQGRKLQPRRDEGDEEDRGGATLKYLACQRVVSGAEPFHPATLGIDGRRHNGGDIGTALAQCTHRTAVLSAKTRLCGPNGVDAYPLEGR
jgi:hypothetical protein